MRPFDGKRVLLVVTGGIAAYKGAFLARRLLEAGTTVEAVLTEAAEKFIGRATLAGITGQDTGVSLWDRPMEHLDAGKRADLIIVAPATADFMAQMAVGRADGLAQALILAADCPIMVCPAMNSRMWHHPATRRNASTLAAHGVLFCGPGDGPLAEGETGPGRMTEPQEIVAAASRALEPDNSLDGVKVVVTAGGTRADIDPVRFIGNRSSGRMGDELASAAWRRGGDVVLIRGSGSAPVPAGPRVVGAATPRRMLDVLMAELPGSAALFMAAAVSDFEPENVASRKLGKLALESDASVNMALQLGPDLLEETRSLRREHGVFTLGFALETEDIEARAREKLVRKGLHAVAANPAGQPGAGPESPTNRITLVWPGRDPENLGSGPKRQLAEALLDRLIPQIGP